MTVSIPFPKDLYRDIIRFSDGRIDPAELAVERVRALLDNAAEDFALADSLFGERAEDFIMASYPDVHQAWLEEVASLEDADRKARLKPLVWKEVTVPADSEVRMQYGGTHYFAKVRDGRIVDADGAFSPSEWASKVAAGTSRNAWRDLWFKFPNTSHWRAAQSLRHINREG